MSANDQRRSMNIFQPRIVDVSSTDWDGVSLITAKPIMFGLHVEIGDEGSTGADLFQMCVCNSAYIEEHPVYLDQTKNPRHGPWLGHMLVIENMSFERVRAAVESLIKLRGPYGS